MTVLIAPFGVSLRDARGHVGRAKFYYQYDNVDAAHVDNAYLNALAIINAFLPMSNATPIGYTGFIGRLFEPFVYGTNAQFANAEDKARLLFQMLDDDIAPSEVGLFTVSVPAPILGVFEPDQETVKPSAATVAAFVAAFLTADATSGSAVTRTGLIPGNFVAGYRTRKKFQRKITIYDKSSGLDEPEE